MEEVYFYKDNTIYYYIYNNVKYKLNDSSIIDLKKELNLPYKLYFTNLSISSIKKILNNFKEDNVNIDFSKEFDKDYDAFRYVAVIYEPEKIMPAYKVNNTSSLFGRSTNCNPYLLTNINNKRILLEIPKDVAKNFEGNYYFLAEDLTKYERIFFSQLYVEIPFDYLYEFDKSNEYDKVLKKTK